MANRPEIEPYRLTNVRVTDEEVGTGSYATIQKVEHLGLICAGKVIHKVLQQQQEEDMVQRFREECRLLSQLRHPNIVQFLGVYYPSESSQIPILVMELLSTNLTIHIQQNGILSKEISYSILLDVALGLHYLHSQTPAIAHRDLSSNNVLLTPTMTAKISDLGVARILDPSRLTQKPGTQDFMPPEVLPAIPRYNKSIDVFSYGIMMIHILSGKWPAAKQRLVLLQSIEDPLTNFIQKCIHTNPQHRATSSEIVQRLKQMVPAPAADESARIKKLESEIKELKQQFPNLHKDCANEIVRLKLAHEIDLTFKDNELKTKDALIKQLEENITSLTTQLIKVQQALPVNQQQQPKVTWKRCSDLKVAMYDARTTIIQGKIYLGGGTVNDRDDKYGIYCYDPPKDKWIILPPASVRYFGLGKVKNQLVTVGGVKIDAEECTNELYTFNETMRAWQQMMPSMPGATKDPAVLSLESIMVVCSNIEQGDRGTYSTVDVLRSDTMQWYKADQLPMPSAHYSMSMTMIVSEKKCYILGGHQGQIRSNKVFYASLVKDDDNAPENDQIKLTDWKTLCETPSYQPAAVEIAGNLCVVGGRSAATKGNTIKAIYMYSPEKSNTWAYIGDLPAQRSEATIAALSNTSFYVIGGRNAEGCIVKTVFNCTVDGVTQL